jgi:hypothetical protein
MKHDIDQLDRGLNEFVEIITRLTNEETIQELIRIWRQPGWTTPAEFRLVSGVLDSMVTTAKQLNELQNVLLEGSQLVGVGG